MKWYFIVWFMAATGARISELLHIKAEHVYIGHLDLYSKGGKIRRLYIPKNLRTEATQWLKEKGLTTGYIFLNRFGKRITTRGIAQQLKHFADKYGMNKEVVYPHSFRHRFAKNFLDRFNDLALLTDLMGHENIETTRIYLGRTANEQYRDSILRIISMYSLAIYSGSDIQPTCLYRTMALSNSRRCERLDNRTRFCRIPCQLLQFLLLCIGASRPCLRVWSDTRQ